MSVIFIICHGAATSRTHYNEDMALL